MGPDVIEIMILSEEKKRRRRDEEAPRAVTPDRRGYITRSIGLSTLFLPLADTCEIFLLAYTRRRSVPLTTVFSRRPRRQPHSEKASPMKWKAENDIEHLRYEQ